MSTTVQERLARLEQQNESMKSDMEETKVMIGELENKLDDILKELARYKGFLGGAVFIVTSVWAFFQGFPFIKSLIKQ